MGYQDRDWYRALHKAKDSKSSPVKDATYNPRGFRRSSGSKDASMPPEPHEWPLWAVVLIWLAIGLCVVFFADRYNTDKKAMKALERQLMDLKDCDYVKSGPCMKIAPRRSGSV